MEQSAEQKKLASRPPERSLFAAWRAVVSVTVLGSFTGFAATTLAARLLGASGFGIYATSINTLNILIAIATMGYPSAILRFGPALLAQGSSDRFRVMIASARNRTLGFSILLSVLGVLVTSVSPQLVPNGRIDIIRVIFMILPIGALVLLYTTANRALGHLELTLLPDAIIKHIFIILLSLMFISEVIPDRPDPIYFAMTFLLGTCVSVSLILYIYYKFVSEVPSLDVNDRSIDRKWLMSALGFFAHYVIGAVRANADIILIAAITTTKEAGIYAISLKLSEILSSFIITLNYALSPRISATFAAGDLEEMRNDMRVAAWVLSIFGLSVGSLLIIWAPIWLAFFGPDFVSGVWALRVAVVAGMIPCLAGPTYQVLSMSGNEWLVARIEATGMVIQLIGLTLLAAPFGATGAAVARCIALFVSIGIAWLNIRKRLKLTLGIASILVGRDRRAH